MKLYIKTTEGTKGSQSAKRLANALTAKLGYKVWRSRKDFPKKNALKYGHGVDKIAQYKWFAANNIPALQFTTDASQACEWLNQDMVLFGRELLNASCGKGIVVMEGPADTAFKQCPVYTVYRKKKREFRVHVYANQVVRVVEKKLRADWTGERNSKIRNLANGYVFCSCTDEPGGLRELAIQAAGVAQSDFQGVDIGFNEKLNELFVIEVNSAPGIEGSNVEAYVNAIVKD